MTHPSSPTKKTASRLFAFALLVLVILAIPAPLFSQSCSLCYTQAGSSGSRMISALRNGILILIVPPTLGTVALIFVVHSKRNQTRRTEPDDAGQDW